MKTFKDLIYGIIVSMTIAGIGYTSANAQSSVWRIAGYPSVTPSPTFARITESDSTSLMFRVLISNPAKERVNISVYSADSGYLHNEDIFDLHYSKTLSFSEVEDGIYTIEISKGRETVKKRFGISTNTYTVKTKKLL